MTLDEALSTFDFGHWRVSHLINLDPGWQAILVSSTHLVSASGTSPAQAVFEALMKTHDSALWSALNLGEAYSGDVRLEPGTNIAAALGLLKPIPDFAFKGDFE